MKLVKQLLLLSSYYRNTVCRALIIEKRKSIPLSTKIIFMRVMYTSDRTSFCFFINFFVDHFFNIVDRQFFSLLQLWPFKGSDFL